MKKSSEKNVMTETRDYARLLDEVKRRIRAGQIRAVSAASAEMIRMYWDIGKMLVERQTAEGWGAGVLRRLSADLKNELPEVKGFSERNLKLMTQFYREYPGEFMQPAVAQSAESVSTAEIGMAGLPSSPSSTKGQLPVALLPWAHNVLLMQKVKDLSIRLWYAQQTLEQGWSRNVLRMMIDSSAHERQGAAVTNFELRLPSPQSDLARQSLKDPYLFDFLTLEQPFRELELETGLVQHLEKFLLELGQGFAFVGRQYPVAVGDEDFYLDLLFYHLKLRCFVVVDLKTGPFKPDYVGKMNFYCSVVDDLLRHEDDRPTIGLILCQDKNKILAEYALRGMTTPIGVSEYQLTRALPDRLKSSLPTIEELERELENRAQDV